MQRRSALFLLFVAGLAAGSAVLWRGGDDVLPVVVPPEPDHPAPPEPAVPGPVQGVEPPLWVQVAVRSEERYLPPSPVRVRAFGADGRALPAWIVAGAGAGHDAPPRAAGAALVALGASRAELLRQVGLAAGETAELRIGARLQVRGRVTGPDQKPVAGAVVWCGEYDVAGLPHEASTDAEGSYELDVPAGDGVPFVVRAPGHAAQWRPVAITSPPTPLDVVLAPATTLEVQLAGLAVAMAEARVFVVPGAAVGSAVAQWPFFTQALSDGVALDANGRAVVEGLPGSGEVAVVLRHPRAPLVGSAPVALKGGRARLVLPVEFGTAVAAGHVVDDQGMALGGVAVVGRAASGPLEPGASQRLLPPHLGQRGLWWTTSDAAGAFEVGLPPGDAGVLALRCAGHAGRDVPLAALRADTPLVLPRWFGGEASLVLTPPRADAPWGVRCDLGGGLRDVVAAGQSWRVALPHAGRFTIELTTQDGAQAPATARHAGVHATGEIVLAAPPPR